jgi:nucleoside-diphosphate-sugar epimerase
MELMEADVTKLSVTTSYNFAAISFTAQELASEIQKHIPVTVTYSPDARQAIADSWPQSIDDAAARNDWGWKHEFTLEKMTRVMIEELKKKFATV